MYKSIDVRNGNEVIILDSKWLRDIESLRVLDRQDFLVCQGCSQPVRVRAGEERRPHFAHKHLLNCSYIDESATLRYARAVLYEWLVARFGSKVSIEKKIDGELFRPIDCWLEIDTKVFGYWIFDTTLKPEKREQIKRGFVTLTAKANFIFTANMLRKEKDSPDHVLLTTTEREFMQKSDYDDVMKRGVLAGQSLHYLDADNKKLLTFRDLRLIHQPQVYEGYPLTSDLDRVLISTQNGEFVHQRENEILEHEKAEQEELEVLEEKRKGKQQLGLFQAFQKPEVSQPIEYVPQFQNPVIDHQQTEMNSSSQGQGVKPSIYDSPQKDGTCVFCGEKTTEWWFHDGKTGQCKCKACLRKGKF